MGNEWNIMIELIKVIDGKVDAVSDKVESVNESVVELKNEMNALQMHYSVDSTECKIKQTEYESAIETIRADIESMKKAPTSTKNWGDRFIDVCNSIVGKVIVFTVSFVILFWIGGIDLIKYLADLIKKLVFL